MGRFHLRSAQSLTASSTQELQRSMHSRAASFAGVLKSTEQFLEENKAKLEPGELAALQQDLQRAKEQYQSLQERTEVAQKELESAVSAAVQQETEKVTWQELQGLQALLEVGCEVLAAVWVMQHKTICGSFLGVPQARFPPDISVLKCLGSCSQG